MSELAGASLTYSAPAKINLYLGVGPTRSDGYHDLASLFVALDVYDMLRVRPSDAWHLAVTADSATVSSSAVPVGSDNLVYRAAVALARHTGHPLQARVELSKTIPVAAGLAGGSSDAAAALVALNDLWGTGCTTDDLVAIAATLGSDVPFCLIGGAAVGSGRGEKLDVVPCSAHSLHWVLATSTGELGTRAVYEEFDRLTAGYLVPTPDVPDALLGALTAADPHTVAAHVSNDLQDPAISLMPGLRSVLAAGRDAGALAQVVSGSGPTVAFLTADRAHAGQVQDRLRGVPTVRAALHATGPVAGPAGVVR